ncbi:tRNA lysidine(34) synthetase TilS [Aquabacterium sp. J223]|uniref:tRNA lysidine(34) synthetase TilS n=1 Tax=Aquabacterium sp. J223 TaxID=2898431 RepID=UPI0021ADC493|nr:tRNA lysidine(34) synthetase TilS [Aquabacterium sp. J223]UUX94663.1 tRNA lysidine(34) synthetase TilS [Aquabacterium sp. J223]
MKTVAVAHSGGRDSTALLHAVCAQARALRLRVAALHVHHGLQPDADRWVRHVQRQCARWAAAGAPLECHVTRLAGAPAPGDSVEAWARRERYAALARMAREAHAGLLLLGHHRTDQAETVLLQALRGGGLTAAAAMRGQWRQDGLTWARPWLDHPRSAIEAYVRRHRLRYVDDPSNQGDAYGRSRLRQRVWPALVQAFPEAEAQLHASARHAALQAQALRDWTAASLLDLLDGRPDGEALPIERLQRFSPAQQALLLRDWLAPRLPLGVPFSLLQRLPAELAKARSGATWPVPQGRLVRQGGWLRWTAGGQGAN